MKTILLVEDTYCPLCAEDFDATELSFAPCNHCSYKVCCFCYNRIINEFDKSCPGCRVVYGTEVVDEVEVTAVKRDVSSNGFGLMGDSDSDSDSDGDSGTIEDAKEKLRQKWRSSAQGWSSNQAKEKELEIIRRAEAREEERMRAVEEALRRRTELAAAEEAEEVRRLKLRDDAEAAEKVRIKQEEMDVKASNQRQREAKVKAKRIALLQKADDEERALHARRAARLALKEEVEEVDVSTICSLCGDTNEEKEKFPCGSCGQTQYCGRLCQRAHWKAGHKEDCRLWSVKEK